MTDATQWFAHTVPQAHATFLAAAARAGVEVEEVWHPLTGPDGEPICSAVVELGPPEAANVLVVLSGIHGIEGYFGSALQCHALAHHDEVLTLPADTKAVLIHLVNPWGTAWSSRENEDNVELLRGNYYCHHPKPANPIFTDFFETMGYRTISSIDELLAGRGKVVELLERYDLGKLMAAIGDGQDTHRDAITWTGNGPTWSKHLIDRVLRERCAGARKVLVLDLHTAVGPPGETVVFTGYLPGSAKEQMVRSWFDGDLWPWPEHLEFYDWVAEVVPGADVASVTMEAGTEQLGPTEQYIFPLDVWIKTYGDRNDPAAAPHLERYRRFFYPETPEWMRSTHAHGSARWAPLLRGFAEWIASTQGAQR
jgi:octopine/nopaline transport system ATP-binding protein